MTFLGRVLGVTAVLALLGGAHAKLDLNSTSNVVVYWGQNSVEATGDGEQKPLAHYCEDDKIDTIIMAFVNKLSGKGGAPEYSFGNISKDCDTIPGTNLKKCPQMEDDIKACQKKDKTILLSIGGEAYKEGGFSSEDDALAGADLIWKTFGPAKDDDNKLSDTVPHTSIVTSVKPEPTGGNQQTYNQPANGYGSQGTSGYGSQDTSGYGSQSGNGYGAQGGSGYGTQGANGYGTQATYGNQQSSTSIYGRSLEARKTSTNYRPFGEASVDGIDLDFESPNSNMVPFVNRLRELMDAESDKHYYLTAAPQCPYPDLAGKDFLNGPGAVHLDALWVQFYNNPCGLDSFKPDTDSQDEFNFKTWDDWAHNTSKNKDVKVLLGVPASEGAAHTGFVPTKDLKPVINYTEQFDSFGGVMMWDIGQAYVNKGILGSVRETLPNDSSKGSSIYSRMFAPNAAVVLGVFWFGCLYFMI